jgi:DNA polymerase-3 subunit beta
VNYLLDGINNINTQTITLSFGDQNSSLLITIPEKADYKYVVMPMRI